jgi:hypothetical protein
LFGGLAEEGDVEQVRLAGIDGGGLRFGDGRREEGVLDGDGVDGEGVEGGEACWLWQALPGSPTGTFDAQAKGG